jgi:hypothetical protein
MRKPVRSSAATLSALVLTFVGLGPTPATAAPHSISHAAAARAATAAAPAGAVVDNVGKDAVLRAIHRAAEVCGPTRLDGFVDGLIASMSDEEFGFLLDHVDTLLDVPTYDPLFFGTAGDPRYALGLHATQLTKTFRQVKGFWDIASDDIQLMAMHPDPLLDAARIAATNKLLHLGEGIPDATFDTEAAEVAAFMRAHPVFAANPLWTLNAFAFSGVEEDPPYNQLPDKLVFGDGFIQAFDSFGLGDVGPRVVMGHEFGHHIQYEDNLFDTDPPLPTPQATRRTELMADTFAAYFGTHKKGLTLNAKRVADALETGFTSGDCFVDDDNHHGTPQQRERAYAFGVGLAQAARPKSVVLPSLTVAGLFDQELPEILTPSTP